MFRYYHHSMDDKYLRHAFKEWVDYGATFHFAQIGNVWTKKNRVIRFKVYRYVLGTVTDVTAIFAKAFHVRTNFYHHFCYTTEDFFDYVWEKFRSYHYEPKHTQLKFTHLI